LAEKGAPIKFGYFLNDGLATILNIMKTEKSIEVGLCGNEGFVGLPLSVGFTTSPALVVMQIAGSGFKIRATHLAVILRQCPQPHDCSFALLPRDECPIGSGSHLQPSA
jgi:hypothetical protein